MDASPSLGTEAGSVVFPADVLSEARPGKRARTRLRHSWMMLDGFLCRLEGGDFNGLAVTEGTTSKGEKIVVGLIAVEPPRTSRIFYTLHLKEETPGSSPATLGDDDSRSFLSEAKAVAADGDCILLRFIIIDESTQELESGNFEPFQREVREELFIYRASPLTLINLPRCGNGFTDGDLRNNIGILCLDDGGFVVSRLTVTPHRCSDQSGCRATVTADLYCMLSMDGQWRTTKSVPISNAEKEGHLRCWVTDRVIRFGQCICWVDYLRGALFYDVSSSVPQLRYVPLPVDPYWGDYRTRYRSRAPCSENRSICVTEDGLKFVDVTPRTCPFYGSQQSLPDCAIQMWKMSMGSYKWVVDSYLEQQDFVALAKKDALPLPKFPLVDRKKSQIIYFASVDARFLSGETRLVKVDMGTKVLAEVTPYAYRSFTLLTDDIYKCTTSCKNLFNHEAFLPCEFSEHLDQDESHGRDKEDVGGLTEAPESSMLME